MLHRVVSTTCRCRVVARRRCTHERQQRHHPVRSKTTHNRLIRLRRRVERQEEHRSTQKSFSLLGPESGCHTPHSTRRRRKRCVAGGAGARAPSLALIRCHFSLHRQCPAAAAATAATAAAAGRADQTSDGRWKRKSRGRTRKSFPDQREGLLDENSTCCCS